MQSTSDATYIRTRLYGSMMAQGHNAAHNRQNVCVSPLGCAPPPKICRMPRRTGGRLFEFMNLSRALMKVPRDVDSNFANLAWVSLRLSTYFIHFDVTPLATSVGRPSGQTYLMQIRTRLSAHPILHACVVRLATSCNQVAASPLGAHAQSRPRYEALCTDAPNRSQIC